MTSNSNDSQALRQVSVSVIGSVSGFAVAGEDDYHTQTRLIVEAETKANQGIARLHLWLAEPPASVAGDDQQARLREIRARQAKRKDQYPQPEKVTADIDYLLSLLDGDRIERLDGDQMTTETHHELCIGVMASCYPHVPPELQQAIAEGVKAAAELGFPVSTRNLSKGGPLFTGGHA